MHVSFLSFQRESSDNTFYDNEGTRVRSEEERAQVIHAKGNIRQLPNRGNGIIGDRDNAGFLSLSKFGQFRCFPGVPEEANCNEDVMVANLQYFIVFQAIGGVHKGNIIAYPTQVVIQEEGNAVGPS